MYKYDTAVTVVTKGGNTYFFDGEYGLSAKRSLDQKTAIDTVDDDGEKRTFIPYEAIDHAVIEGGSQQVEYPTDANCVVKSDSGVGALKITNTSSSALLITVALKTGKPETYGAYSFTHDLSNVSGFGQGWYSINERLSIAAGDTVTINGIPSGTQYSAKTEQGSKHSGIVPANEEFSGDDK